MVGPDRWLDLRGSVRDVFIGWVAGDGLAGKGYSSKLWQGTSEAQKPAWMGLCWLPNSWNEAQSTVWTFGLSKEAATLDIASPDTCQCLKPPLEPSTPPWIHPCYNQPRVSRPKFRLETNSTVVWLYAGGASLILPDVRFGTVSLD